MPPLPDLLALIASVTSPETAMVIARVHGGTRMTFLPNPKSGNWLVELVGQADASAIAKAVAHVDRRNQVLIPLGPQATTRQRWLRMKALIDEGLPKRQIARALHVHERTVQAHRNGSRKTVKTALDQDDLFGNG